MAGSFSIFQYQTDPPYQPTLTDDTGTKFVYTGYSASNFSIKFSRVSDGYLKSQSGTFTVDTVGNTLVYAWGATDTNMAGTWNLYLDVSMLSGGERRYEDTMIVQPAPAP